jgi:hypothetical protein
MSDNKIIYWFHGDVCLNIQYSDNLPASDKPYVIDEMIDEGTTIKHRLKYNGSTRNIIVPKQEQKDPKYIRSIHNAVHRFLEDGRKESINFVVAGKHQFCTRKQYERIISVKK